MGQPPTPRAQRTRDRIQGVALDLIGRQGYAQTTVEQIARGAGVSHMTFFRHFATKAAVVLDDPFDPAIADAVAAQPADLAPVARVCAGLRVVVRAPDLPADEHLRTRVRTVATTSVLAQGMWANTRATERAIADALGDLPEATAAVAAAAAIGALTAGLLEWGCNDSSPPLRDCLLAALEVLEGGAPHG